MPMLRFLCLLVLLCPQLARAQAAPPPAAPAQAAPPAQTPPAKAAPTKAAPAKAAPAAPAKAAPPSAAESAPEPAAPVAPPAPPGVFPQTAQLQGEAPPPPAPVAGGYPYGYGYGYAPAPVDPRRDKTLSELQQVDVRIASVRKQQKQYSIAGPLAMTATGYGFAAIAGLVAVFSWVNAEDIQSGDCPYSYRRNNRCDIDDDGVIDKHDERDARILARTFGAISALGAGVGIAGTVLLMKRLAKRRQYGPELDELGTRRGQLLHELRYGGGYSQNGGLQLNVSGRF